MRRAIAVLAGLLMSGSAIAQTTPNWALHYVPPPAEWNALWASKQDYNAPGVFTTLNSVGNATITGNLTVTGTINGGGGSFLPIVGGTLTKGGSTITFTPGATLVIAPIIASSGTAGMQLNGGTTGVRIVGGGPLIPNNGITMGTSFAPANAAITPALNVTTSLTGTTTTVDPSIYSFIGGSDNLIIPNAGTGVVNFFNIDYSYGGAALTGDRRALRVKMTQTATTNNKALNLDGEFSSAIFATQINQTEGGTGTSQGATYGGAFAGSSTLRLVSTATGFHEATNWEADMNLAVPVYKKFGWKVTQLPSDIAQGALDGAFVIENGGTSANNGWHNGFLAIEPNGAFPYATDGWILNAPEAQDYATFNTMAGGINIVDPTFTTGAIRSRNFLVDGLGTVRVGNGYLAKTSGGVSLDTSGSVGPAEGTTLSGGAIVSGGTTGFSNGITLYDPYGGTWFVASSSGGVVLSVTCSRTPYFASATPPANPVTLTPGLTAFGNTTGALTVNMTWTQPNTIALSPSGGPTTIGGTLAVTGALTGPTTTQAVDTNTTALASTAFVLGQAASATPLIDGTATVGTSTRYARADHIHPTDTTRAALAGATFTGQLSVGNNTTTQALNINGPAGIGRVLIWQTAASKRWQLFTTATAEGGANAGSDFAINAYDDTGTLLTTPLTITRSTGLFNFATALKFSGSNIVANGAIATTVTSLGPTGSHTTIQEWLTVQNGSGTTRYIPLY